MAGLRYFALKRLPIYDTDGEPLTLEPGELLPDGLADQWGERIVNASVEAHKIAPLPAWIAEPVVKRQRVKAAA